MNASAAATIPLTAEHIQSLSSAKLDKGHLINTYLQGQKRHVRTFAAEGKALATTWDRTGSVEIVEQAQTYGFEIPVLKPRVPRSRLENVSAEGVDLSSVIGKECEHGSRNSNSSKQLSFAKHAKGQNTKEERRLHTSGNIMSNRKPVKLSSHPAKLPEKSFRDQNSDNDRIARMTERRERKRAKRAIIRPSHNSESEQDGGPSTSQAKKTGKKTKGKNNKTPHLLTGLALMHGFSATNVGKNRLTLKPPVTFGVFNKGKASAKTQVNKRKLSAKANQSGCHFSESHFLNKTPNDLVELKQQVESSGSDTESESGLESMLPSTLPKENRTMTRKIGELNDTLTIPAKRRKAFPGSEVWDIELENPISEQTSSMNPSKDGTIVLDTRALCWDVNLERSNMAAAPAPANSWGPESAAREDQQAVLGPDDTISPIIGGSNQSSASLGPSQSASQCGRRIHLSNGDETVSKYFGQFGAEFQGNVAAVEALPTVSAAFMKDFAGSRNLLAENTVSEPPIVLENNKPNLHNATLYSRIIQSFPDMDAEEECKFVPSPPNFIENSPLASSLNSIERALRDYEVDDHVLNAAVYRRNSNTHYATSDFCQDNDSMEVDSRFLSNEIFSQIEENHYDCYRQSQWSDNSAFDGMGLASECYSMDEHVSPWEVNGPDEVIEDYEQEHVACDIMLYHGDLDYDEEQYEEVGDHADTNSPDFVNQFQTASITRSTLRSASVSDTSDSLSDLSYGERFCQGRTLLRGSLMRAKLMTVFRAEADVAKGLRGHWRPQKL